MNDESFQDRLPRILNEPLPPVSERRSEERILKARELYRVGIGLNFQNEALTEGYLLADTAAPEVLSQYVPNEKHNGSLLSYLLEMNKEKTTSPEDKLRFAFLKMRWLDIKLKSEHALLGNSQYPDDAAMKDWFETLEYFIAYGKHIMTKYPTGDQRILSRVCLDRGKNVYKQDPPDKELIYNAIDLWPEDYVARSWGGRRQDLVALVGDQSPSGSADALLEFDNKWYGKFCYELAWNLKDEDADLARSYLKRGLSWEKQADFEYLLRSWPDVSQKKAEAVQTLKKA